MEENIARLEHHAEHREDARVLSSGQHHLSSSGPPGALTCAHRRAQKPCPKASSASLIRQELPPPRLDGRRLLNISCRGKGDIVIAGQTGFAARRIVERRLNRTPEMQPDESLPFRNRPDSLRFTGPFEPQSAGADVADFVGENAR